MNPQKERGRYLFSTRSRSVFHYIVADGMPGRDKVALLIAPGGLAFGAVMGVNMCRAVGHSVIDLDVSFETLMQVPGLSDVNRSPSAILAFFGVDEIPGQRTKNALNGKDFVVVFFARLPNPTNARTG